MTVIGTTNPGDEQFVLAGSSYWFMFPDRGGVLGFSSSSPFAPKSVSGDRAYSDYDAISAAAWADLTGGMGQDRATDMTKYYNAVNVDARGGRLILGPLVSEAGSGSLSLWTSMYHTYLDYYYDFNFGNANSWTWELVDTTHPIFYEDFVCPADYTGIDRIWLPLKIPHGAAAVTVKIYADNAGAVGSELASTTIAEADKSTSGHWTQAIFASTVAVTAGTTYWISVGHSGAALVYWRKLREFAVPPEYTYGFWLSDPLLTPDCPPHLFMGAGEDLTQRLWAWAGRFLYWIDGTSLIYTPASDGEVVPAPKKLAADIQDALFWKGSGDTYNYIYIALGDGQDMQKFDANVGTEQWAAITGIKAEKLCIYDNMLWRLHGDNLLSASVIGDFSEVVSDGPREITVGNAIYPARNLIGWGGFIYVGCDDGLYKVTYPDGYPVSDMPAAEKVLDFTHMASPVNFSFMVEHQGDLFFSLANGIIQYTSGGVVRSIGPETGLDLASAERAVYRAGLSTVGALWIASEGPIDNPSIILSYSEGAWHPVVTCPRLGGMIRSLCVEPGYFAYGNSPRFYFGADLSVCAVDVPMMTQRRWLWSGMTYATDGIIDMSWFDGNIRTINKDWVSVEIHATGLGSGAGDNYIYLHARYLDGTWSGASDFAIVNTDGITRLAFPASTYSAKIQIRVRLYRGSTTTSTPNVEAVVLRYIERPQDLKAFSRTYLLGKRQVWRNGTPFRLSMDAQVAQLETLRESAEPLLWYPWFGGSYYVHIVDYNATEVVEEHVDGSDPGSILVTVRLQVVDDPSA